MLAAAIAFTLSYGERRAPRALLIALLAIVVFALWPVGAHLNHPAEAEAYFADWWQWNRTTVGLPASDNLTWIVRNFGWYAWPLWPFAFWTIYSWRHFVRRPHIALPLLILAAGLTASLLSTAPSDREFLIAVPALVVLATFGASSLKRSAEDAIDWFSLAVFSLALVAAWLTFGAWMAGSLTRPGCSAATACSRLRTHIPVLAAAPGRRGDPHLDCDRRVARACQAANAVDGAVHCRHGPLA